MNELNNTINYLIGLYSSDMMFEFYTKIVRIIDDNDEPIAVVVDKLPSNMTNNCKQFIKKFITYTRNETKNSWIELNDGDVVDQVIIGNQLIYGKSLLPELLTLLEKEEEKYPNFISIIKKQINE